MNEFMQSKPRMITPQDWAQEYPAVSVKVMEGDAIVEKPGRVIGRTLEKWPRWDIRLEDGTIINNKPASEVAVTNA